MIDIMQGLAVLLVAIASVILWRRLRRVERRCRKLKGTVLRLLKEKKDDA